MFIMLRQWFVDWYHEVRQSRSMVDYFMTLVFLALVIFNTYVSIVLVWYFTPVIVRVSHVPCLTIFLAAPFIACSIVGYTIIYSGLAVTAAISLATPPTMILYHFMGWNNGEFGDIWWSGMGLVAKTGVFIARIFYVLWAFIFTLVCASPCGQLYALFKRAIAAPTMDRTAQSSIRMSTYQPLRTGGRLDPPLALSTPSSSGSPDIELGRINRLAASGSSALRQDVPIGSPGWRKPSGSSPRKQD
ncbi:hypothetical protein F503_02420 [Ophiostoma piceae UAMH 11346]|uniref:Uncharacterized protein n=1 Tax=Ophiostoma piceae (strain UAMH 11346) TaxID=1262450 RepID=S3C0M0_OPHP1|nr:hypothetical protein F503_02420 [Ophiostoma piceae UAMH 11346]